MDIRNFLLAVMEKDLAIPTDNITEETRLKEDLKMDSLELVELTLLIEKRLAISVNNVISTLSTFGEVETFLSTLCNARY